MHFDLETHLYQNLMFVGISHNVCSYLSDRFHHLYYFTKNKMSAKEYKVLLDQGFRRAGFYVYRPFCLNCLECKVLRVPINTFKKSKSQKHVWNKLIDHISYKIQAPEFDLIKLSLYYKYKFYVHKNSLFDEVPEKENKEDYLNIIIKLINKNYSFNENQLLLLEQLKNGYMSFFVDSCLEEPLTKELIILENEKVIGVGIFDLIEDYWSSVYFFYDPDYSKFSLGTFSILLEIELAKRYNANYYYIGYYIEKCNKMNYKKFFRPNEILNLNEKNFQPFIK
jgi:arginine-tRNA-protein transferase